MKIRIFLCMWFVLCITLGVMSREPAHSDYANLNTNAILSAHTLEFTDGSCSSVAVGKHTLLTAAHCMNAKLVKVDGKPVKLQWMALDGHDHALIGVDLTFPAHVAARAQPVMGEAVTMIGAPGGMPLLVRHGVVAAVRLHDKRPAALFDLRAFFGDSGAGIFNERGQIVGIQSMIESMNQEGVPLTIAIALPLSFTTAQWELVQ